VVYGMALLLFNAATRDSSTRSQSLGGQVGRQWLIGQLDLRSEQGPPVASCNVMYYPWPMLYECCLVAELLEQPQEKRLNFSYNREP